MLFFANFLLFASSALLPSLVPRPVDVQIDEEQTWYLQKGQQIGYDSSIEGAKELAQFVATSLSKPTGISFTIINSVPATGIYFGSAVDTDEYHMSMDDECVTILACNRDLLFYGFQTLLQLLPPQIYSQTAVEGISWSAPCAIIHDKPRFQWRGLMVDPCRHWVSVDDIKTILDGMSHYKLNVLHFHMTEDQAWRLDLKKFPDLTKFGAIREGSPKHWDAGHLDGIPYGPFFYTEEDVKEIIRYAAERSIKIVPEIEMPGHALAALSGYPQYSCTGGPFKPRCFWGVEADIFCAGNDAAITFLEEIVDEVLKLFDNVFFHVGGDECPRQRWDNCAKCQKRMKDHGLKNTDQLQCWFTQHFANYLEAKGRRLVGWDEILSGGLPFPDSSVVMSWRGTSGGQSAARQGHDVVMTPNSHVYFDYWQHAAPEPYEYIGGYISSKNVYTYNPTDGIEDQYKHHIIGVQGNLWSEYIWNITDLQWKAFPRAVALAETGWALEENKNWQRFINDYTKKDQDRLKAMGLNEGGIQFGTQGTWSKGEFTADKWLSVNFPVDRCLNQKGHMECAFGYKGGANKLHVKNVKLVFDGAVVGEDKHEGIVWDEPSNTLYSLNPTYKPGTKISISADVMCEGGDDCEGHLYVYAINIQGMEEEDQFKLKFKRNN